MKVVRWDEKTDVRLHLWDIASQEYIGSLMKIYLKEKQAAIIVVDLTTLESTLRIALIYKQIIDREYPPPNSLPCVLLANNCDVTRDAATPVAMLDEVVRVNGSKAWFETSTKLDLGINAAMTRLISHAVDDPRG